MGDILNSATLGIFLFYIVPGVVATKVYRFLLLIARDLGSKDIVVQLDGKLLEHIKILYTRSMI